MSTSYNDITGKAQKTKGSNDQYRSGWDAIFGPKKTVSEIVEAMPQERQDTINAAAEQKVADMETYHLRSFGDVTKQELDAYISGSHVDPSKP